MIIYGSVDASRAWWVAWICSELGLEFENDPIMFLSDEIGTERYRAIHPGNMIPAIDDEGFVLWESMAINLYLARKHGQGLNPDGPEGEALAMQWSFWAVTRLEAPLLTLRVGGLDADPESERGQYFLQHISMWSEAELARCHTVIARPFAVLDEILSKQAHLLSDHFTVADLNVSCILSRLAGTGIDLSPTPHLRDWLVRCWSRPGCGWGARLLADLSASK
jgi:glutathione S-transferase